MSENRRRAARRTTGDGFAAEIARLFDLFAANEGLERFGDREDQDFRGIVSHRSQGQTGQTRAVIDLALEKSVVGRGKRHQNDFEVDAFVFGETR